MPGISVSKIPIPFRGAGGINWSLYWATLISATVENAAPTHVVLTFSTAQTSLGASDFTIAGFTVSSASWTGAVLTLVLSSAVTGIDELFLTFVKTGDNIYVSNNVYSLYEDFTTDDDAPVTSPRACEPGPGTLVITDTGNKCSIAGGVLVISGATTGLADPKIDVADKNIIPGRVLYARTKGQSYRIGYKDVSNPANPCAGFFVLSNSIYVYGASGYIKIGAEVTVAATYYEIATIQRADGGGMTLIKGGAFTNWTILLNAIFATIAEKYSSHVYYDVSTATEVDKIIEKNLFGAWGKNRPHANTVNVAAITTGHSFNAISENSYLEFHWNPATGETLDVMVRRTDDDNCWVVRCVQAAGGTGTITLYQKEGGTETQRAQITGVDTSINNSFPYYIKSFGNVILAGQRNKNCNYASATFNNTAKGVKFSISGAGVVEKIAEYNTVQSTFDPLTLNAGEKPKNIWPVGDSKTLAGTFATLLATNIEADNDFGCYINPAIMGVGGYGIDEYITNIAAILAARNNVPDYILFNIGVNDSDYADLDAWEANYLTVVDAMNTKYPNAKIYCPMVWFRDYLTECNLINARIVSAISQRDFIYLGFDERVWLEGGDDGVTMTTDGIHYSAAGHIEAANQWKTVLGL